MGLKDSSGEIAVACTRSATSDYFSAMGAHYIQGDRRDAGRDSDLLASQAGGVVNATAARAFWPHEPAIGKQLIAQFFGNTPFTVTAVVADIPDPAGRTHRPVIYLPFRAAPLRMWVVARFDRPAKLDRQPVRAFLHDLSPTVQQIDRDVRVANVSQLEGVFTASTLLPRIRTFVGASFASLALFLASAGIYGVLTFVANQRQREISIRMALGADRWRIICQVLSDGLKPVAAGLSLGIVAAAVSGKFATSMLAGTVLPGTLSAGAVAFLIAPVPVLIASLFALYFPAKRAASIPPAVALNSE
jgi:hypothetical protein